MCDRMKNCFSKRRRRMRSLLLLIISASTTQAFVTTTPPSQHRKSPWATAPSAEGVLQRVIRPTLNTLQRELEYAALDAKVELDADVIGGTINVKKIEIANGKTQPPHLDTSTMWQRRNARSAEEGIRREKTTQLSSILAKARPVETNSPRYAARTITGLINALAEEVDDLDVEVDARSDSPMWGKQVDAIRIKFSRLGFKPLRMGGLHQAFQTYKGRFPDTQAGAFTIDRQLTTLDCPDEVFDRMDLDNSGALDSDEIAEALTQAAAPSNEQERSNLEFLKKLASELVALYDFNGDGVVDRTEYQSMVEDMAALREAQEEKERKVLEKETAARGDVKEDEGWQHWFSSVGSFVAGFFGKKHGFDRTYKETLAGTRVNGEAILSSNGTTLVDLRVNGERQGFNGTEAFDVMYSEISEGDDAIAVEAVPRPKPPILLDSVAKAIGSITLSDLKLDLRRLLFGAIPILKHIMPGGPLILEPFTATVTGSFNRDDIMNSFLLDAGLRRLVAQALKRRVRSLRDFLDGAVFYGRTWKMSSKTAPVVQVLELTNVEFDEFNKLIITGRVRVQTSQEVPVIENSFKLRTKVGTRRGGRVIRLVEPELALVLECPQALDDSLGKICDVFGLTKPCRPEPIYSFFPIYSPFKLEDNDGFDLGEDNRIKSIYIEDGALRFELSAVLRPGRFLGNHYLAFTVPNRTFIITLDRVKEGIRAARNMKKAARALQVAAERKDRTFGPASQLTEAVLSTADVGRNAVRRKQPKSFFSRFVEGYLQAERDGGNERFATAIRDFFGRQGRSNANATSTL